MAGEIVWGLKYVQWGLLLAILLLTLCLIYRERFRIKPKAATTPSNNLYRHLIYIVALISIVWTGRDWFTPVEKIVIETILFAAILGVCWQIYKGFTIPQLRWVPVGLFVGCMIFMGQTIKYENLPDKFYNTISLGGMMGRYRILITEGGGMGCVYIYPDRVSYFDHRYVLGGIGFSQTLRYGKFQKARFGIRAYYGMDNVSVRVDTFGYTGTKYPYAQEKSYTLQNPVFGINPYFHNDWRWFGIGGGFHVGSLYVRREKRENFSPHIEVRLGRYDIFFVEGGLVDNFPGNFPPLTYKLFGIGTGFGSTDGTSLKIGVGGSGSVDSNIWYINPTVLIKKQWMVEAFLAGGKYPATFGGDNNSIGIYQFALRLHYRFNHKSMKLRSDKF